MKMTSVRHPTARRIYGDIPAVLHGSTILITGAAGLVGTQLLYRLLYDSTLSGAINRVIAVIRAKTAEDALKRLPETLRYFATQPDAAASSTNSIAKLVVLNGDCARPDFGLDPVQLDLARQADIVINAAADTRFMLPLVDAIGGVTDIAYMVSRFCFTSSRVRTYIHLSTTFVGWVMKNQSTISEDFDCTRHLGHEEHANTYLQAKALGENCVSSFFKQQAGRAVHQRTVRILRLATLGPAVEFPHPGWGSGWQSSPISAIIATESVPRESLPGWLLDDAALDVIPVDIACNQIIALTAAAHRTYHQLPDVEKKYTSHPSYPRTPRQPGSAALATYHIASGLPASQQLSVSTMNLGRVKLSRPFIGMKRLLETYQPFISKTLRFGTARARAVLGLDAKEPKEMDAEEEASPPFTHRPFGLAADISSDSDPRIACGDLEVDCETAVRSRWGSLSRGSGSESGHPPGWVGYLECARDGMQRRAVRQAEEYLD